MVLVGHSKTFGMTGWRLGYACGSAEIILAMTKVQQYSFVCAPSVVQYAALADAFAKGCVVESVACAITFREMTHNMLSFHK